jgi:hypothetical protein
MTWNFSSRKLKDICWIGGLLSGYREELCCVELTDVYLKRFVSTPEHSDGVWTPSSLLFSRYQGFFFHRIKADGAWSWQLNSFVSRLRMCARVCLHSAHVDILLLTCLFCNVLTTVCDVWTYWLRGLHCIRMVDCSYEHNQRIKSLHTMRN